MFPNVFDLGLEDSLYDCSYTDIDNCSYMEGKNIYLFLLKKSMCENYN